MREMAKTRVNHFEDIDDRVYLKNLALLEGQNWIDVLTKIEKADLPSNVEVITARTGLPSLKVKKSGNKSLLLHSTYDPLREAKNLIMGYDLKDADFVVILGFGLGYHVREILTGYPQVKLILVVEPNPSFFKLALHLADFSWMLSSPRIRLILETEPVKVKKEIIQLGEILLTGKIRIVLHPASCNLLDGKFVEFKNSINEAILWSRANLTTNIVKGHIFQQNILTNIPEIIKNPGIKNLFGKFKNNPVICVAAGPSLKKNIHLLKKVKNKALIICVDAALKTMLHHGIKPDIVVSIDYGRGVRNLFGETMQDTRDLFLVADPEVYPAVLSDFQGGKFIVNVNKPLLHWLTRFTEEKGFLEKGSSVAHTAFSLAQEVGGNPIIFMGLDLSYPDGFTHAEGATVRKKVVIGVDEENNKKYLLIKKPDGKWIIKDLIMVKDIHGREIPTDPNMYSYLIYFEKLIDSCKARCIDATEGGVRIKGTEVMSLEEAIEKFCTRHLGVKEKLKEALKSEVRVNLDGLKKEMERIIIDLREINFCAKRGEEIIKKLLKETGKKKKDHQKMQRLIQESNHLVKKITTKDPCISAFLEQNMYSHLYLVRRKNNLLLKCQEQKKKFVTQIEKVRIFYNGVKKASCVLVEDFVSSLQRLVI